MKTFMQNWKAPTLYFLMAGFLPYLVLGVIGGWLLNAIVPNSPMFGQIIRATFPAIAAMYGVRFTMNRYMGKGTVIAAPKMMVYRASVLYALLYVALISVLVLAGIIISKQPSLYPFFFVMVIGNIIGLSVFYRTGKKYVREMLGAPLA